MPNYSSPSMSGGSDSTIERYLTMRHGNLHEYIPALLENRSQSNVARLLSDDVFTVTQSWLSHWLRGGNAESIVYRQHSRWVPTEDAS